MQFDTSMYGKFELPAQPNLLAIAGQAATVQNQMAQNQLLQNEFEAQEALGTVLQQSTNQDGKVDFQKLLGGMAAHPKLAKEFPVYYKKLREAELVDAQVAEQALKVSAGRAAVLGQTAQMILASPGADRSKVVSIVAATLGRPDSGFTPGEALNILLMAGESPEDIKRQAETLLAGAVESKDFLKINQDAIKQLDLGSSVAQVRVDPVTGHPRMVSSYEKTMDPNKANEPVTAYAPDGSQFSARTGSSVFGPQIGAQDLRNQPQAGVSPQPGNPGVIQTAPAAPTQPAAFTAPTLGPMLKPPASQEIDKSTVMDFEKELIKRAQTLPANKSTIDRAAELIPSASVGPGAEMRRAVAEYAIATGVDEGLVNNMLGGDIAAMQELGKILLQQSVTNMVSTYGSYQQFSTQEFEAFKNNNPNLNTSQAALEYMVKKSQALIELQEIEQEAYAEWKRQNANKPIPGVGFVPEFSKFAVQYMREKAEENNYLPKKKKE